MIVERDIGRLAKYTFDMGGAGDLLSLALSVPPWEDLHEIDAAELKLTNLVTTDLVADVLPHVDVDGAAMAELTPNRRREEVRRSRRAAACQVDQDGGSRGPDRRRDGAPVAK